MMKLMLQKQPKAPKNQDGFITMIVIMVVILAAVIYLAYKRVTQAGM